MKDRFPPPFRHSPELLMTEVAKFPDYDTVSPFELPEEFWDALLGKIDSGNILTEHEKVLVINSVDRLSDPQLGKMVLLFADGCTEDLLFRASRLINRTLNPGRAIQVLLSNQIKERFGTQHICKGIVTSAESFIAGNHEVAFRHLLKSEQDLSEVLLSLGVGIDGEFTPGQLWVLRIWINDDSSPMLIEKSYMTFWQWLRQVQPQHKLALAQADRIVAKYLDANPNWNGQVLEPNSIPGQLVSDIRKIQQETGESIEPYPALYRVVNEYLNLQSALKDLSALVPQRGEFWRKQLPQASRVHTRSFRKGPARIAVAMEFGDKVVVEFGPVGNAAHIYPSNVFYKKIQTAHSWRDKEKTIGGAEFPDGRIVHNEGWIRKTQSFLRRELKRG